MTAKKPKNKCLEPKSKRAPQPRQEYRVNVEYQGGIDQELDQRLKKLVGRGSDGSGFFFLTGTRDIGWVYHSRDAAEATLKRIKAAHIRGVKVEMLEDGA